MKIWHDNDLLAGRYRLLRELGRDRGALLWEAHDDREMGLVHLRILQQNLRGEPLVVMRFTREAALAGRLDHPALSAARELIDDKEALALVYDVPGTMTLADRLRRGPVDPTEAAILLEPILAGLEFAHRRGVIHRNLSPDHIWLDGSGGARVSGFGGAKVLDMVGLTTQSMAFGLSHYGAPEQWFSQGGQEGDADPRTDVWALGVVLFEMIVGRPPVPAGGPGAMVEAFNGLDLRVDLGEQANSPVSRAIQGALRVERHERIPSMRAMADVLLGRAELPAHLSPSKTRGVPCWKCEHPRIPTLDLCLRCGQGPLIQNPGEGSVDVFVPKFRRGEEAPGVRRFAGRRRWWDLVFRTFHPQLDSNERARLTAQLKRAGATFDEKSQTRMAYSPSMLASKLTAADAYRLQTFLIEGEAAELKRPRKHTFDNPKEVMADDQLPILVKDRSTEYAIPRLLWALKGASWSSPVLYTLLAGITAVSTSIWLLYLLIAFTVAMAKGVHLSADDLTSIPLWMGVALTIVSPIWIALVGMSWRHRRPAVSFEKRPAALMSKENEARWVALMGDLANERDRHLAEDVLAALSWRGDNEAQRLLDEVEHDVALLGAAPRDDEWQRLQVAWEGLVANAEQAADSPSGAARRERLALAMEMKRHEKAVEESELARARMFDVVERVRALDDMAIHEDALPQNGSPHAHSELKAALDELRLLHQSLVELEGTPHLDISEATREEVDLHLELPERFDVIRPIASGGMASVVLAYDHYRGEEVALKVVLPHLRDMPQIGGLMRQEFEATRKVHHPGLVAIHEHLKVDGVDVLVMEYVPSIDLKTMIRWRGALPPAEVRSIGAALLDALGAAHRKGVIHGDIKPANILVGEYERVVLVDLGLARMEYLTRDTELEARQGTPGYAAPEILEGGLVDERADIFGLGLTLLEALTGELPFATRDEEPVAGLDVQEIEDGLQLRGVLTRAAARDVSKRFRSAEDMRLALAPGAQSHEGQQAETATRESCHQCGTTRLRYLQRCASCGARRYPISARSRFVGWQVVVEGDVLDGDDVAAIRRVVGEFQRIEPAPHFESSLSESPVLLTPSIAKDDALAMAKALEREQISTRVLSAAMRAPLHRAGRAIRRLLTSSVPFLALAPVLVLYVFFVLTASPFWLASHFTYVLVPLIAMVFLPVVLVITVELMPVFRSATRVEKGSLPQNSSQPAPAFEDHAIEALQHVRSERTRALIQELVEAIGALRERWVRSAEFEHLVDALDDIALNAFAHVDVLNEAEALLASVDPRERMAREDEAHLRVVRIGSALLSLARNLRELGAAETSLRLETLGEMETVFDFDGADDAEDVQAERVVGEVQISSAP
ncbi:serine/threonine protein kinase [Bradymonadaceae bacterium TMQ3]|nr:serine/threonine protein kinase [Bradymonadaceae bacterium TMQ3]TXC75036.1 serine/threonine protein kinase [Bradymonadales bacterium TMQ1]